MLDRNGTLVRCAPQFILNCDAQRVLNANNWERADRADDLGAEVVYSRQRWRADLAL